MEHEYRDPGRSLCKFRSYRRVGLSIRLRSFFQPHPLDLPEAGRTKTYPDLMAALPLFLRYQCGDGSVVDHGHIDKGNDLYLDHVQGISSCIQHGIMTPTLCYFYRSPDPIYFSVEKLFTELGRQIAGNYDKEFIVEQRTLPYPSSWKRLIPNINFAKRHQRDINHITGDVHYALLRF